MRHLEYGRHAERPLELRPVQHGVTMPANNMPVWIFDYIADLDDEPVDSPKFMSARFEIHAPDEETARMLLENVMVMKRHFTSMGAYQLARVYFHLGKI